MAVTPVYALPYQTLADPPHGPNLGSQLALAVEAEMVRIDASISAINAVAHHRANTLLGADAASVTISAIPSTLKELRIIWRARSTAVQAGADLRMRINNNTGGNYHENYSYIQNTTQTNFVAGANTYAHLGVCGAASSGPNNFGHGEAVICGWNANNPNVLWRSHFYDSAGNSWTTWGGSLFFVSGPYTSLVFFCDVGNLLAGSEFTVYGSV